MIDTQTISLRTEPRAGKGAKAPDQWDKDPGRPKLDWFNRKSLSFFFFWLCWVFLAVHRLTAVSEGYSLLQCTSFSLQCLLLCGARALDVGASLVAAGGLWSMDSIVAEA